MFDYWVHVSVKYMSVSVNIPMVDVCDCVGRRMCVHTSTAVLSCVIAFPIPPAHTSAPGPLADKETGIHRLLRRQELVNS